MARQKVYPHEEILANDINNFINSMETIFFKSFIGNALPNLPAFIGTSFLCEINGSDMVVKKGIAFMEKDPAPTDGSTPIALIQLASDKTVTIADLGIALPAAGSTKQVSVGVKWKLTDKPTEQRTYTTGTGNVDRATVTMNEWDSSFNYTEGTTASVGFVKIAEITLNNTGIQSIADNRNYFNMFDPDLFTLFGRKNLAINHVYDGSTNLIELPFEFSSAVDRVDQVSVRKETRGSYNEGVTTQTRRSGNVTVGKPSTASINVANGVGSNPARVIPDNVLFISSNRLEDNYHVSEYTFYINYTFSQVGSNPNYAVGVMWLGFKSGKLGGWGLYESTSNPAYQDWPSRLSSLLGSNNLYLTIFIRPFTSTTSDSSGNVQAPALSQINLLNCAVFNLGAFNSWGSRLYGSALRQIQIYYQTSLTTPLNVPTQGIYGSTGQTGISPIYDGIISSNFKTTQGGSTDITKFDPSGNLDIFGFYLSTTNPITQGSTVYEYKPSSALAIPSWTIKLKSFKFTPTSRELELKLESTASTFPSSGLVFSNFRVKKGTQVRFNTPITNFDSRSVSGNEATYTETLTQNQANALFTSSETLNDVSFEFDLSSGQTLPTKDYELLTKSTDYNLLQAGTKSYLRLLPAAGLTADTELIISHIIPPNLLDQSSGTVLSSDLETEVNTLKALVRTLQQTQATNTSKIATLEAQSQADTMTTLLWGYGAVQAQASDNANNANSQANTAFATPANRNSQSASNLSEGALVSYAAPAATGYYHPWLAIEISKLQTLRIENDVSDETDLWSRATASVTVNNKAYVLYARSVPLAQTETLTVVVKSYN